MLLTHYFNFGLTAEYPAALVRLTYKCREALNIEA